METNDLIGKYVHFKDNPHLSISTLKGGLTLLQPTSLFYLKIETAEKYKDTQFILLTGTLVNSDGQPQIFSNELINPSDFDMNGGKSDDQIQPVILNTILKENPDFGEWNKEYQPLKLKNPYVIRYYDLDKKNWRSCDVS